MSVINGTSGNDNLLGGDGADLLTAMAGQDTLDGSAGNDTLLGGAGNDSLVGGDGDDAMDGGLENDSLSGGIGADQLDGSSGNDTLNGGDGADKFAFRAALSALTNLDLITDFVVGTDKLLLQGPIFGSLVNNGVVSVANFRAAAGATALDADDFLLYDTSTGALYYDADGSGSSSPNQFAQLAGAPALTASDFERDNGIYGSGDNDTLQGSSEPDQIFGMAGNDSLDGGNGNDSIEGGIGDDSLDGGAGDDTLAGGDGGDTYYLRDAGEVVTERGSDFAIDVVVSYLESYTLGINIENGIIVLTGTANLTGNGSNNSFTAGAGDNVLDGGNGTDAVTYSAAGSAVTVSLALVGAQATGGSGSDTLINIENLTGSSFADYLEGDSRNNTLIGAAGNDTLVGGNGDDNYLVSDAGDVVIESNSDLLVGGVDTVTISSGLSLTSYALPANVENLTMSFGFNNTSLRGNVLDNVFVPGGTGNDTLDGGAGSDTVDYSKALLSTGMPLMLSLAIATAQAAGGYGNDTFISIENLIGGLADDRLTGNDGANLVGGNAGNDTVTGGADADRFLFNTVLNAANNVDVVTDFVVGTDKIQLEGTAFAAVTAARGFSANNFVSGNGVNAASDADDFLLYDNASGALYFDADGNGSGASPIQFATLSGAPTLSAADFSIVIISAPVAITGTGSNDSLTGTAANETFSGRAGNDVVDGGTGIDVAMFYGNRQDYLINKLGTTSTVQDNTPWRDGIDTVSHIERLRFQDSSLALDVDGNAGKVAKILGAVFGKAMVANPQFFGIGLYYADTGMSYESLVQLALTAKLGAAPSNRQIVDLLYTNVVGSAPSDATAQSYVNLLTNHTYTPASLAVLAADTSINTGNINLVGLAQTGITYTEFAG